LSPVGAIGYQMRVAAPRIETIDIILPLEKSEDESAWRKAAAAKLGVEPDRILGLRLRKHSIDARQRQIKVQLRIEIGVDSALPDEALPSADHPSVSSGAKRVVIVGCGPAGMFAALRCLEQGVKPVILERGKDVSARRFDLAPIFRKGTVIEDSNYCFGEGGAGTFSDGKLYTRAKKRGAIAEVYRTLVAHGAPDRILIRRRGHSCDRAFRPGHLPTARSQKDPARTQALRRRRSHRASASVDRRPAIPFPQRSKAPRSPACRQLQPRHKN
jgi:hypothetical protein